MTESNLETAEVSGAIIKELRLAKGLNQAQLARELNISGSTVRMIELGKRKGSMALLQMFSDYFNVSLDYIQGKTKFKNSYEVASELLLKLEELDLIKDNVDFSELKNIIKIYIKEKK